MPAMPPPLADERQLLLAYLAQQRDGVRHAAYGLTDDQARLTPCPSELSIGGLVKHTAAMERSWMDTVLQRERLSREEQEAVYTEGFTLLPDQTLADVITDLDAAGKETEDIIGGIDDLARAVPVPQGVPWFPDDVEAWSVRWVLLHLIEEQARHAGHADIIRQAIDGATMYELLAGAEGWPATEWLTPWRPAS